MEGLILLWGLFILLFGFVFGWLFNSMRSCKRTCPVGQPLEESLPHYCVNCRWCVDKEFMLCGKFRDLVTGEPSFCDLERFYHDDCWEPVRESEVNKTLFE